jgi:TrmH family RNA methyltransferase
VITSVDNPRVREVVRLRKARERRREGVLIAEGVREVERALAAGLVVRQVFHAPELLPGWTDGGDRSEEVSARVLAKMSYRDAPEGVVAVFETPARAVPADASLLVVAVGLEKPGNLGAIARSADAAGADGILVAEGEVDPWNPNAIRASTGSVFTLPIVEATLDEVAALPQRRVAAVLGAATPHFDADLTPPTAFLIGAEDSGLDERWRAVANLQVEIPMSGTAADSLNASAAAAVLLFEAVRQRARGR